MLEVKEKLIAKYREIFGYMPGDDYEPRVRNALTHICQGRYKEEDLIETVDTSIFSNGKAGMVLTVDAVCVDDLANSTSKFIAKYEDIHGTLMHEDEFLGMDITALELRMKSDKTYRISVDKMGREKLMRFLDYAAHLARTDEQEDVDDEFTAEDGSSQTGKTKTA